MERDIEKENKLQSVIMNRKNYKFRWFNLLYIIFCCHKLHCCKTKSKLKDDYTIFKNGQKKLEDEMDIRKLLDASRNTKLLSKLLLNKDQQALVSFDRGKLIAVQKPPKEEPPEQKFNFKEMIKIVKLPNQNIS